MNDLLSEQVLVLNKNFQVLGVTDVKEAFKLLYSEKAAVMDQEYNSYTLDEWSFMTTPFTEKVIRSISQEFPLPEVIRLLVFDQVIEEEIVASRQNIFYRDKFTCQYCRKILAKNELTIDHVIPRSRREEFKLSQEQINDWPNIVSCCRSCNVRKNNRTPEEANMLLLKKPTKPKSVLKGFEFKKTKPSWRNYLRLEEKDESNLHSV